MSLRIKLPARAGDTESPSQSTEIQRKHVKRRIVEDSDEDDGADVYLPNTTPDRSKRPRLQRTRTNDASGDGATGGPDEALDVGSHAGLVDAKPQLPESRASSPTKSQQKQDKTGGRTNADGPSLTKKARTMLSEQESEDTYKEDDSEHSHTPPRTVDDVTRSSHERKRHIKQTSTSKGKTDKGAGSKTSKGKAKTDTKNVLVKDERKAAHVRRDNGAQESNAGTGTKRSRQKVPLKPEDTAVNITDDSISAPKLPATEACDSPPAKEDLPQPPPPKKRKLPTIKKNKASGSAGPATPSSVTAPPKSVVSAVAPKVGAAESGMLPPIPAGRSRKTPAAIGNADFDLRNASVYADLFKPTGGSTPRSGLSRRDKEEERRKELDKMRDDARAKRAVESQHIFNLQGQLDKISRFEEILRSNHSSALYPNFLAAKWREEWERDKRRCREGDWEGQGMTEGRPREGGETREIR